MFYVERPSSTSRPAPSQSASRPGSRSGTGATGGRARPRSSRSGGSGRARSRAATSTARTWRRSGPRATARRWSCGAPERRCLPAPPRAWRRGLRHLQFGRGREGAWRWMGRLRLPYAGPAPRGRGERGLLKARRDPPGRGRPSSPSRTTCASSARPIAAATCELDHPVLRLAGVGPPGPVSRVPPEQNSPGVLAPDHPSAGGPTRPTWSRPSFFRWSSTCKATNPTNLPRGRRGPLLQEALANAKFPAPVFCFKDNVGAGPRGAPGKSDLRGARPGRARRRVPSPPLCGPRLVRQAGRGLHAREENHHLGVLFVEPGRHDARGPGVRGPGPAAHGGGVVRGRGALSINALIGLWARNVDLVYTMRTSNHEFDGTGCQALRGRRGRHTGARLRHGLEYVAVARSGTCMDGLVRKKHPDCTVVPVRGGQGPRGPVPEALHRGGASEEPVRLEGDGGR